MKNTKEGLENRIISLHWGHTSQAVKRDYFLPTLKAAQSRVLYVAILDCFHHLKDF